MALRHVSGGYIEATANLPAVSGATLCGFFVRRADRNATSCLILFRNQGTGHYSGIYTPASNDALEIGQNGGSTSSILTLSNDAPFFVAVTYNGSGTGTGKLWARKLTEASLSSVTFDVDANLVGADYLRIGDDSFGSWFDGDSCGFLAYDRVLTDAEILAQSKRRRPINRKGLNRWYPEIATATAAANAVDWSGNGRDGSIVGSPTASTGSVLGRW